MSMRRPSRWSAFASFVAAAWALGSVPARADDVEPAPNSAPVWLVVSTEPFFDLSPELATDTIMVNIGSFVSDSADPSLTTFSPAPLVSVPFGLAGVTLQELYFNQATVFGTVRTSDEQDHMYSRDPNPIPPEIQAAVHAASTAPPNPDDELVIGFQELLADPDTQFPTPMQIAENVAHFLNPEGPYQASHVAAALFASVGVLRPVNGGATFVVTSEGEMFPHDPDGPVLVYSLSFDDTGALEQDFCAPIAIDVKPGSSTNPINIGKKGQLPVALLGDADFDASDVVADEVTLLGVPADQTSLEDVDLDGDLDFVAHWDVPTLVEAGLDPTYDALFVVAELSDGSCVAGTDAVDVFTKK